MDIYGRGSDTGTIPSKIQYDAVPGFFVDCMSVPAPCGRKTPVPDDFLPESRKTACIPGPPDAQVVAYFARQPGPGLDFVR